MEDTQLTTADKHKKIEQKIIDMAYINKGRINRLDYFFTGVGLNAIQKLFEYETDIQFVQWLFIALSLFFTYIGISVTAKRFRDIGVSGWWCVPHTIALTVAYVFATQAIGYTDTKIYWATGLISMIVLGLGLSLWPREKRDNKYGEYEEWGIMDTRKLK
ncbi:MAG: DUF805 domain-containing protein [Alphaproteobacteria bacterium]|nr:DUF805 domain-containing protein [Alphaproteobacteria bacterium]